MKNIWIFLNGKKTAIAAFLNLCLVWISKKGWIDENDFTFIAMSITVFTGVAIGHKIFKGKNGINR